MFQMFCVYKHTRRIKDVTSCGTGCHIGGMPDDLVLFAPSWRAQHKSTRSPAVAEKTRDAGVPVEILKNAAQM